jgi:hypothetical protein
MHNTIRFPAKQSYSSVTVSSPPSRVDTVHCSQVCRCVLPLTRWAQFAAALAAARYCAGRHRFSSFGTEIFPVQKTKIRPNFRKNLYFGPYSVTLPVVLGTVLNRDQASNSDTFPVRQHRKVNDLYLHRFEFLSCH